MNLSVFQEGLLNSFNGDGIFWFFLIDWKC